MRRWMFWAAALVLALAVAGCRRRPAPGPAYSGDLVSPKGREPQQWQIKCRDEIGNCYKGAYRACPDGWRRIDGADHSESTVHTSSGAVAGGGGSLGWAKGSSESSVSTRSRLEWIVECGEPG